MPETLPVCKRNALLHVEFQIVRSEIPNDFVDSFLATSSKRGIVLSMTTKPLRFETVPLEMLEPHADYQLRWTGDADDDWRLMRSIEQLGVLEPLVVEERTYRIVKGHRRYGAAKVVGLAYLPCLVHRQIGSAEYERLRFILQETWKPLTKRQLKRSCQRLRDYGIDVTDDLIVAA